MLPGRRNVVWLTSATLARRSARESRRTSNPPTSTSPAVASSTRRARLSRVDLPLPETPASTQWLPAGTSIVTSSTAASRSGPLPG